MGDSKSGRRGVGGGSAPPPSQEVHSSALEEAGWKVSKKFSRIRSKVS